MKKTRAIEILSAAKAPFEVREFAAAEFTAEEASEQLGIPLAQVFKTLVLRGEKHGELMAVVPGDRELSLKKLAHAAGEKRVEMAKLEELQRLTGYLKGGVSPLGSKKRMPVYIDASAREHERISVSAGLRGVQLWLPVSSLESAAHASVVELAEG